MKPQYLLMSRSLKLYFSTDNCKSPTHRGILVFYLTEYFMFNLKLLIKTTIVPFSIKKKKTPQCHVHVQWSEI